MIVSDSARICFDRISSGPIGSDLIESDSAATEQRPARAPNSTVSARLPASRTPPNVPYVVRQAARLRQYNTFVIAAWEQMRLVKRYRTPLTTRCFSRVYIWARSHIRP